MPEPAARPAGTDARLQRAVHDLYATLSGPGTHRPDAPGGETILRQQGHEAGIDMGAADRVAAASGMFDEDLRRIGAGE